MKQRSESRPEASPARPLTDVFETAETLVLVADVPGADQESIELVLQEDVLTLRARPRAAVPEGWQLASTEFELPSYERTFRLRADIEREPIAATLHEGRLRVELRKRKPRVERIEVRAS